MINDEFIIKNGLKIFQYIKNGNPIADEELKNYIDFIWTTLIFMELNENDEEKYKTIYLNNIKKIGSKALFENLINEWKNKGKALSTVKISKIDNKINLLQDELKNIKTSINNIKIEPVKQINNLTDMKFLKNLIAIIDSRLKDENEKEKPKEFNQKLAALVVSELNNLKESVEKINNKTFKEIPMTTENSLNNARAIITDEIFLKKLNYIFMNILKANEKIPEPFTIEKVKEQIETLKQDKIFLRDLIKFLNTRFKINKNSIEYIENLEEAKLRIFKEIKKLLNNLDFFNFIKEKFLEKYPAEILTLEDLNFKIDDELNVNYYYKTFIFYTEKRN